MTIEINDIERQAAEWAAKTDGATPSSATRDALTAWLAIDQRHLGAYVRAKAMLVRVERLSAHRDLLPSRPTPAVVSPFRRRMILTGTIAASLALLTVGGLLWNASRGAEFSTGLGETRIVALPDGSKLTLNTQSKAKVRYSRASRTIMLEHGEVLFDVAKNKEVPFLVEVQGVRVRAVGTSFTVQAIPGNPVEVLVREGTVKIERPGQLPILLPAISHAIIAANGPVTMEKLSPDKAAHSLAWLKGYIYLRNQTLAAAAREFSRYSSVPIVIDDPKVSQRTVTGIFVSTDPKSFARAAAVSLGLRVQVKDNVVRLARRER